MAIPTRADVDVMIREKLASDPDFRGRLVADPRAAVSELIGQELPDLVSVEVHEETLTSVHIVLPSAVTAAGEISDEDLELVAGGGVCWSDSCTSGP